MTTDSLPTPPRRAPSPLEWLCYFALLIMVAIPLALPRLARSRTSVLGAAAQPEAIAPPGAEILLSARYVVGTEELLRAGGKPLQLDLLRSLDDRAFSTADQFRALLVKREYQGPAAVDAAIAALARTDPRLAPDARLILERDGAELPDAPDATPEQFRQHHGWFADLALSHGLPPSDPLRARVIAAATRTLIAVILGAVVAVGAFLMGLVLLIILIVLRVRRRILPRYPLNPDLPPDRRPYLEGFIVYLALMIVVPLALERFSLPYAFTAGLYVVAPLAAIAWAILRAGNGRSFRQFRAATGLHLGRGLLREMLAGLVTYLAGLPLLAVCALISFILIRVSGANAAHPIENELSTDPRRMLLLFSLACVFAPIFEELMFRGFFYTHLRSRLNYVLSALISAFVFAAIHPQGWAAIPALGALAFTFATMREYRGSLIPSMTAHALNNGFVLAMLTLALS